MPWITKKKLASLCVDFDADRRTVFGTGRVDTGTLPFAIREGVDGRTWRAEDQSDRFAPAPRFLVAGLSDLAVVHRHKLSVHHAP